MKLSTSAALAVGLSSGALLAGCGSQTKTVSATDAPTEAQTTGAATRPTTKASTTPTTTSPGASTDGGTPAPSATRTAPAPAFTKQETHAEGVGAAAELVRRHGYTPNSTSEYHPEQTLRVLVGTRTGSADGYGQRAFFFVGGRYIGTDTKEPSATVKVLSQGDTEVTLSYSLYRDGDPLSSPSGGHASVRFELNDGRLTPLGTIPPARSSSGLSRN
ncbi:MAG TPA: LppP/LprE family lipoprotein [Solirubrobacteraceae bacterium]|nr:LppP/LprE family lipoprotein [Solirubrobacteraceae bacterium]